MQRKSKKQNTKVELMNFKASYANTKNHVREIVWIYRCVWYEKQAQIQDIYYTIYFLEKQRYITLSFY